MVRIEKAAKFGEAVRIDGVTYWAGEDLEEGALVAIGGDNLVRALQRPTSDDPLLDAAAKDAFENVSPKACSSAPRISEARLFTVDYLTESMAILAKLDTDQIDTLAAYLSCVETIYVVGHGGSAATASHAANDLRKLCGKNAICPTDNASLMTALANDYSFDEWIERWLDLHLTDPGDDAAILFLSVGGGNGKTSRAMTIAARAMKFRNWPVLAIVGRDGGELAKIANSVVVIPNLFPEHVTPHVEGLTSVLMHLLVTHPSLAKHPPTWRS